LVEEAVTLPNPLPVPEALRVGAPEEVAEGAEDFVGTLGDPDEVGDPVCVPLPPAKLPEAVSVGALPLPLPLAVRVAQGVAQEEGVAEDVPVATQPLTVTVGVSLPEDRPCREGEAVWHWLGKVEKDALRVKEEEGLTRVDPLGPFAVVGVTPPLPLPATMGV
jgi:hypothetical protein